MNINSSHNQWRVAMIWTLLLIPFTAYFLFYLFNKASDSKHYKIVFIILIFFTVYACTSQIIKYSSFSYLTKDDLKIGKFTQHLIKTIGKSKIYVVRTTTDRWKYLNVLVASQNPGVFITTLDKSESLIRDTLKLDPVYLSNLKMKNVCYILFPAYIRIANKESNVSEIIHNNSWTFYKLN